MISNVEDDNTQFENFAFDNFELVKEFMKLFAKNEKYKIFETLSKTFNEFSKIENYVINITKINRSRAKIKNKMCLNCNRKKKFKNKSIDKQNVISKRINCSFHAIDVFNEKDK